MVLRTAVLCPVASLDKESCRRRCYALLAFCTDILSFGTPRCDISDSLARLWLGAMVDVLGRPPSGTMLIVEYDVLVYNIILL